MIRIQTFPIDKAAEANAFMEANPPRSTDKQSGIVFHNGNIVIIYDDGKVNPEDRKGKIRGELEGDQGKRMLIEHSLGLAKSALDKELENLRAMAPEGYKIGMPDEEIRKLLATGTEAAHIPNTHIAKFKESVQPIELHIQNLDNEILMDTHELKRISSSIQAWEKMLVA